MELVFADLPSNDWNKVMMNSGALDALGFGSRLIFSTVSGSFTRPLQLPGSINFASSSSTIHYLTEYEPTLDAFILAHSKDARVQALNAQFAARDLDECLKARAIELKPGGYFICNMTKHLPKSLNNFLTTALHRLINDQAITQAEGLQMNLAMYSRTRQDFEAAIERNPGLFELVEFEDFNLTFHYDLPTLAVIVRAFTEVKIRTALLKSRTSEEAQSIVELFYNYMTSNAYEDPTKHPAFQYFVMRRK